MTQLPISMKLKPIKIEDCPQFFTATILDWKRLLKPEKYKLIIIDSLHYLTSEKRVILFGYVIMDNHLHLIWKPTKRFSLKHTQLCFLKFVSQRIKRDLEINNPNGLNEFYVNLKDRKYQFWQRNSLGIELYSNNILEQKLNYIHKNPVKARICLNAESYRFSSAGFYQGMKDEFEILTDYRL